MQSDTDVHTSTGTGTTGEEHWTRKTILSQRECVTPRIELFSGRRVSGIHILQTLVRRICTCHRQTSSLD